MTPSVYVVIAACGQPELLRRTLRSLAACAKSVGYCGAIIVENGPRCGLAEVVAECPREFQIAYRYSEPPNKSLALNRVLPEVGESLAVFTDDDVQFENNTLVAYARGAAGRTSGEFYGGPVIPDYEASPPPDWLLPLLPRSAAGWRMPVAEKAEIAQPEFIGPNFAAFAGDILRAGGFDTRLGPGSHMPSPGEDTEIQARLLARGVRGYYLPDAAMHHRVRAGACSVDFAIHRAERNGVYWGIAEARRPGFFPRRWVKLSGQWLNDLMRIRRWRSSADEPRRVRAEFTAARWNGRWQGIRLGWNWDDESRTHDARLPMKQAA